MARIVNISDAKAQLSRLVAEVEHGGRVVIGNAGRPVAVLVPYSETSGPRLLGGWAAEDVWVADDFDDPLPPEVQATFEDSIEPDPTPTG